ncbi:Panacea domain-containing protein [Sedimentimonas flavescens]|uniref:Panacea domain-containing protein n=1 Tax=Sedimentimonas flavescens TaxID=2851012 RepID=UPI0021A3F483|nr:Panacea domain-containing protein [Sedimentimonas flavescens]MCT2540826.1 Panacea domain-containing protein [Sedimentimonas flavescens]
MPASLGDIIAYLTDNYPIKSELSKARITKMVYLADWKSAQRNKKQLSNIRWFFHNFGPYVDDVIDTARSDPRLKVTSGTNMYGDRKESIDYIGTGEEGKKMSIDEKKILDEVISETRSLYWQEFIKLVYSTPPIKNSNRYTYLDLIEAAKVEA